MRAKPFAALFAAVRSCVQEDASGAIAALTSVPAASVFACAARHKCAGLLLHGLARMQIHDPRLRELTNMLRRYAAVCAFDANALRGQIADVAGILRARAVPHALLKGSARLMAGDNATEWTHAYDIDILVPLSCAQAAASALLDRGYRYERDEATVAGFRRIHHHLAPLVRSADEKPVELHVALMPTRLFSLPSGWDALQPHLERIPDAPQLMRLDAFGRALHMALHGAGLYRLADAAQIALELRSCPDLYERVGAYAIVERIQPVAFQSVLLAGAQLAGLQVNARHAVRRHLEWTIAREDLPRFCSGRMQLADAWFACDGALSAPAMRLGLPAAERYDGTSTGMLRRSRIVAGRIVAAAAGVALAGNVTRRTLVQER